MFRVCLEISQGFGTSVHNAHAFAMSNDGLTSFCTAFFKWIDSVCALKHN